MGARGPTSKGKKSLAFTPGVPPPPDNLDAVAVAEYNRYAAELASKDADILQQVDMAYLSIYAQGFSDWKRLTVLVREQGETLNNPEKGTMYPNPNNNAKSMAQSAMEKALSKLAGSPADRARLAITPKDPAEEESGMADVIKLSQRKTG